MLLLRLGLRTNSLERPEYVAPIQRLTELASTKPDAMILLGRIYASQKRDHLALNLFRRAASVSMPDGAENPVAGEALVYQGEIQQRQGDDAAAKEAFRRSALDHDNALGYYYLSQLQERGSALQEEYLQKAASSGVSNAWYPLADMYFDRARSKSLTREARRSDLSIGAFSPGMGVGEIKEKLGEKIEEMKDIMSGGGEFKESIDMGKEWLYLSANAGNWNSIVHLASLLKLEGSTDSGLGWLAVAEKAKDPKLAEVARDIRKDWLAQADI
jgi:tetratricopeptide (TPR) repeat protein